jgi:hypothetical protein
MLEPQTRSTLTDLLRPPAGFTLGHAVGTTFTLALDAALSVPLSFAARRLASHDDPLTILDALRRATERVDVFAQAGELSLGTARTRLVAFLEPMLHPVSVRTGIFHPKVWFLEFERDDERAYRFVCASRNLTSDRSWDVVISLDGAPGDEDDVGLKARNAPIVGLLCALPDLAVIPLLPERRARIDAFAERIEHVAWEAPADTTELAFHVWGTGVPTQPTFGGDSALLVSPFLQTDGLTAIRNSPRRRPDTVLVSRAASIDALPRNMSSDRMRTYVLDGAANSTPDSDADGAMLDEVLTGLHAKAFVFDRGRNAHVFLGSLNATRAALHSNVEVLVEFVGKKRQFGVDATLQALGDLVVEYDRREDVEPDPDEEPDRQLDALLRTIAGVRYVVELDDGSPLSVHVWRAGEEPVAPAEVSVEWRLLNRAEALFAGLPGPASDRTLIADLAVADVSPYLIVTVRDERGARSARSTVVLAELRGAPADRLDAIIASYLKSPADFVRFLTLLLELAGVQTGDGAGAAGWASMGAADGIGTGLFEALIRAVGARSTGLDDVARVVEYLRDNEQSGVFPPGFDMLWESVNAAQERMNGTRNDG